MYDYKRDITSKRLKEKLSYDSRTGLFTWLLNTKKPLKGKIAGSIASNGYWDIRVDGSLYKAHRLAWLYVYGVWPDMQLDHINGNRSDNRITNLRRCSRLQNGQNRSVRRDSSTRVIGVFPTINGKFQAKISANKRTYYLGTFSTKEQAEIAYQNAKRRLHKFQPVIRLELTSRQAA